MAKVEHLTPLTVDRWTFAPLIMPLRKMPPPPLRQTRYINNIKKNQNEKKRKIVLRQAGLGEFFQWSDIQRGIGLWVSGFWAPVRRGKCPGTCVRTTRSTPVSKVMGTGESSISVHTLHATAF